MMADDDVTMMLPVPVTREQKRALDQIALARGTSTEALIASIIRYSLHVWRHTDDDPPDLDGPMSH